MSGGKWIAALALTLCACGQRETTQAEKLEALEGAYKVGLLTNVEYELKKKRIREPATKSAALPEPQPSPPAVAETKAPEPTPAAATEPEPAPAPGCVDAEPGGERKLQRVFSKPGEQVHASALQALRMLEFRIDKNTAARIEASRKKNIGVIVGASGEKIVLQFKQGSKGTTVSGETKKNFVGRLTQRSWTDAVLTQMECLLR